MQSSHSRTLQTAYDRYGPGTDRRDIGAGYMAALAAVVATVLYVGSVAVVGSDAIGIDRTVYFAELELHWAVYSATRGLLVVVPAAFFVGVVGWRLLSPRTTFTGTAVGGLGAIATYLVAFAFLATVAVPVTAAVDEAAAGIAIANVLEISALSVVVGFVLTWWVTVPIGCLTGLVYANRVGAAD